MESFFKEQYMELKSMSPTYAKTKVEWFTYVVPGHEKHLVLVVEPLWLWPKSYLSQDKFGSNSVVRFFLPQDMNQNEIYIDYATFAILS